MYLECSPCKCYTAQWPISIFPQQKKREGEKRSIFCSPSRIFSPKNGMGEKEVMVAPKKKGKGEKKKSFFLAETLAVRSGKRAGRGASLPGPRARGGGREGLSGVQVPQLGANFYQPFWARVPLLKQNTKNGYPYANLSTGGLGLY